MLGSKTLYTGLRHAVYLQRCLPAGGCFFPGPVRCAAHSSRLKSKPRPKTKAPQRSTFKNPTSIKNFPLIAQIHGVGPNLQEIEDVEQKLKEIDEKIEKLNANNTEEYKVFVSDIKNQIQETYSKVKESLGQDNFQRIDARARELKEVKRRFKNRSAEPKLAPNLDYGTPDPTIPMSKIPCHGCGALLHCQDEHIQGYLPYQKFEPLDKEELEKTLCQRCHLLKYHKISLNIRMNPHEFERIIQEIRPKVALVIVIVDLLDMPNSIVKDLLDMIGRKHHVYIVGNKVDMLPKDGKAFLERVKASLAKSCAEYGLEGRCVKHTCLVSAKTGFGIEELVSKLFQQWDRKGDVYLIGSTNVGKSSLFNALLSSDYCRTAARDVISRAVTSVWPGTTLGLLKYPIARPSGKGLFLRTKRLIEARSKAALENHLDERQHVVDKIPQPRWKSLIGFIGTTVNYTPDIKEGALWSKGLHPSLVSFSLKDDEVASSEYDQEELHRQLLVKRTEDMYENAKWCYDTPGVIQPSQVINYLTQRELSNLILSKSLLIPRTFLVHPGKSLFVGGLGRIDLLECRTYTMMTVHSPLPVFVVATEKADTFYEQNVDRGQFRVPVRKSELLPPFESKDFQVSGLGWRESAADVVLSSAGWVSVTTGLERVAHLECFTPGAKGLCLRQPSLLALSVNQRGKRVKGQPMFEVRE